MKEIKTVKMAAADVDLLNAAFQEYVAKKDILTSVLDVHASDEDYAVVKSPAFAYYEKEFGKAKVYYDAMMKAMQEKYVPEELQKSGYRWEVNFDEGEMMISEM